MSTSILIKGIYKNNKQLNIGIHNPCNYGLFDQKKTIELLEKFYKYFVNPQKANKFKKTSFVVHTTELTTGMIIPEHNITSNKIIKLIQDINKIEEKKGKQND
jgi:hypothetical protein